MSEKLGPKTPWEDLPEGRTVQAVPVPCNKEKTTQGRREIFEPLALSGLKNEIVLTCPGSGIQTIQKPIKHSLILGITG